MKLVDLKMKKAELRNRMDEERKSGNLCIEPKTFIEYQDVIRALKWAESRLLKPIMISLVILILTIGGCISNTLDGMRQDIHNASRPADQAKWTK